MILKNSKINYFSKENLEKISDKEYEHVLNAWKKFEMKTMKDYQDLYLKCDVLLLANVFEKFRNNSLRNYGLYPSHYFSAPGLSWEAMLKIKQKLNLNLFQILTCIYSLRKLQEVEFPIFLIDTAKPTINVQNLMNKNKNKKIISLEVNNLYSYVMSKFIPKIGFKWIDPKEFDLNKYSSNSSKGWVLEVDLEYPKELPELYNDYPLALDKIEIKREMFSEYQLKIADLCSIPIGNVKKSNA